MTKRTSKTSLQLRWWSFSATAIAVTGATGLFFALNQLYPTGPTGNIVIALFFVLLFVTVGATIIPVSIYVSYRFGSKQWLKRDPNRLIRHAIEAGTLVVSLAYLQLLKALDWTIGLVLVGVFVLMETFFLTRS
jgi:hypothetical protein